MELNLQSVHRYPALYQAEVFDQYQVFTIRNYLKLLRKTRKTNKLLVPD